MLHRKSFVLSLAAMALAAGTTLSAANAAPFYEGKTITMLVGFPPGSGIELGARLFAPYIAKYMPGNPKIIVKNMPGGGGQKAANFVFEKAKPNGLTILFGVAKTLEGKLGRKGARVDHSKVGWIGVAGGNHLAFMRKDVRPGVNRPADIVKVTERLKVGGRTPSGGLDLAMQMSLDLLGVNYNYITGYGGEAKMYPALRNGELQMQTSSLAGYRSIFEAGVVKKGIAIPMFTILKMKADGSFYVRDNENPDLPSFIEVYQETHGGKMPSGPLWEAMKVVRMHSLTGRSMFTPPGVPTEAIQALRIGWHKARQDKDFIREQKAKFNENWSFLDEQGGDTLVAKLNNTDPAMLNFINKYINEARSRASRRAKKK